MKYSAAFMAACCLTSVLAAQAPGGAASPEAGDFVQVGAHRMYVRCLGRAGTGPTVILESGGGGSSADWAAVQRVVPVDIRTCAYDRAGLGRSEPGPGPRTMTQETFELRAMLAAAKIGGPYVLVGQSVGGLAVRLYAHQFGADIAGMVLVDPTHESSVLGSLRYGGMVRLREKATGKTVPAARLTGPSALAEPPDTDYFAEELAQLHRARRQTPRQLGGKPLVILAAGRRPPAPPGIGAEAWSALRDERDAQLRDLTALSSNSAYEQDASGGHSLHTDNPELVARAIRAVVEAARTGARVRL